VGYLCHVKKIFRPNSNEEVALEYEEQSCMDILNVDRRSGLTFAECEHMKQFGVNARFVNDFLLSQESLKDLSASGCHKLLKDKRVEECISLRCSVDNQRAPLVVASRDGERFIHFSVFEPDIHYYSRLGRVAITCDMMNGTMDCRCCKRKRSCVHKNVCTVHPRLSGHVGQPFSKILAG